MILDDFGAFGPWTVQKTDHEAWQAHALNVAVDTQMAVQAAPYETALPAWR